MMMREERAKQFAPFDAMKGLQDALRDREERFSRVERREISDEQIEKNSEVFARLCKGMRVTAECYRAFHDVTVTGIIAEVSFAFKYLKINDEKVYFDDVYSIAITDAKAEGRI